MEPVVEIASAADDAGLRRLMRDIHVPGAITVAFEREPSFFRAAGIEGDQVDIVAIRVGDRLVGTGTYARRDMFVNGAVHEVGYMTMARVESEWRRGRVTPAAFQYLHQLMNEHGDSWGITTMMADSSVTRSLLHAPKPFLPEFVPVERICTLVIPTWRRRRANEDFAVRAASEEDLEGIVACLRRNGARRQFAVAWKAEDFNDQVRTLGLSISDFTVAHDGGRIIGCVALWDQSAFKQSVIKNYARAIKLTRGLVNLAAPLLSVPRLPARGSAFAHAYLSHLAVDDDDQELTLALLSHAYGGARDRAIPNLTTGFSERDPRLPAVKAHFGGTAQWSLLCLAVWAGHRDEISGIDQRPAHLEIATL